MKAKKGQVAVYLVLVLVALAVLIELGIPTECDGFNYLLQAIVLFY